LQAASAQHGGAVWPFDLSVPPAIALTTEVPQLVGKSWPERRDIVQGILRSSLVIRDLKKTTGKKILVFDDVFTDGLHLNEIARVLKINGRASVVSGIVLARQPFQDKKK